MISSARTSTDCGIVRPSALSLTEVAPSARTATIGPIVRARPVSRATAQSSAADNRALSVHGSEAARIGSSRTPREGGCRDRYLGRRGPIAGRVLPTGRDSSGLTYGPSSLATATPEDLHDPRPSVDLRQAPSRPACGGVYPRRSQGRENQSGPPCPGIAS